MYAIYEGDGKALESYEEAEEEYDSLGIQAAEDFIRKLERDDPEFIAKIKRLPNALRTARKLGVAAGAGFGSFAEKKRSRRSSFSAKPRSSRNCTSPTLPGKITAEDQIAATAAIRCSQEERAGNCRLATTL